MASIKNEREVTCIIIKYILVNKIPDTEKRLSSCVLQDLKLNKNVKLQINPQTCNKHVQTVRSI